MDTVWVLSYDAWPDGWESDPEIVGVLESLEACQKMAIDANEFEKASTSSLYWAWTKTDSSKWYAEPFVIGDVQKPTYWRDDIVPFEATE